MRPRQPPGVRRSSIIFYYSRLELEIWCLGLSAPSPAMFPRFRPQARVPRRSAARDRQMAELNDEEDMDELEQMPDDGDEDEAVHTEEDEPPPRQRPSSAEPPRLAIRDSVLKEVVACGWEEARTKISPDALQLTSALMHSFVHELRHRATAEAAASDAAEVTPEHLERILPQLLLDFGP